MTTPKKATTPPETRTIAYPGPGARILHEPPLEVRLEPGVPVTLPAELATRLIRDLGCKEVA